MEYYFDFNLYGQTHIYECHLFLQRSIRNCLLLFSLRNHWDAPRHFEESNKKTRVSSRESSRLFN